MLSNEENALINASNATVTAAQASGSAMGVFTNKLLEARDEIRRCYDVMSKDKEKIEDLEKKLKEANDKIAELTTQLLTGNVEQA